MNARITYPPAWSQRDRDELDAMFERARRNGLWFFHGGLNGPLWFSPDELQAEQSAGKFIWGAVNWSLRNPQDGITQFNNSIGSLMQERGRLEARIAKSAGGA